MPAKDPYAARTKALASQVQRLRGWVGTDPSRRPELVDALNDLVGHRLDGHAYAAAGADAQDAVKQAVDLMLANGPLGPYTDVDDAVRTGTALVQLAALQAGIGLVEAAAGTLDSWDGIRTQVAEAGTDVALGPAAGRHALSVAAQVALLAGDAARANAYADAVLALRSRSDDAVVGLEVVDVERLASDARWAAGSAEQSLGHLHAAKEAYEALPEHAATFAEPLAGLYRDLADRLGSVGETDLALANRRVAVERLRVLATRTETFRSGLASTLTDLADDLLRADRVEEALAAAQEAEVVAGDRSVSSATRLLAAATVARVAARSEHPAGAAPLRGLLAAEGDAAGPAVRLVVSAALAETLRAEGLDEAAAATERQAAELDVHGPPSDRARGAVSRGEAGFTWAPLDATDAYGAPLVSSADAGTDLAPTWLEQERAEARREEADRADEARRESERRDVEASEAEQRQAAEQAARAAAEEEARTQQAASQRAAEEADAAETKRRREERLRQHQAEVEDREREERAVRRSTIDARLADLDAAEEPERNRLLAERATLAEPEKARETLPEAAETLPDEPMEALPDNSRETSPEPVDEPRRGQQLREPGPDAVRESADLGEASPAAEEAPAKPVRQSADASGALTTSEPEPDDLELAEQALREARTSGGRREVRTAAEAVVVVLRGRYAEAPGAYGGRLRAALEELASARLRAGDLFGSRSASREAKTLR